MKMKNQACDNFLTNSNLSVKKSVVRLILLSYLTLMTLDLQGMMKVARVESASEGQQEVPSEYEKNLDPNVRAQAAQQQAASALGVKLPFSFSASVRAFFSKIGRNPEAVAESLQNASPSRVAKMQEYLTRMNKFTDVGIMRGMKAAFAKFKARMSGSASDKANAGSQFAVDLSGSGGSLDHVASLVATAEGSDVSVKSSDGLQILSDPTASSLLSTSDPATASLVENLQSQQEVFNQPDAVVTMMEDLNATNIVERTSLLKEMSEKLAAQKVDINAQYKAVSKLLESGRLVEADLLLSQIKIQVDAYKQARDQFVKDINLEQEKAAQNIQRVYRGSVGRIQASQKQQTQQKQNMQQQFKNQGESLQQSIDLFIKNNKDYLSNSGEYSNEYNQLEAQTKTLLSNEEVKNSVELKASVLQRIKDQLQELSSRVTDPLSKQVGVLISENQTVFMDQSLDATNFNDQINQYDQLLLNVDMPLADKLQALQKIKQSLSQLIDIAQRQNELQSSVATLIKENQAIVDQSDYANFNKQYVEISSNKNLSGQEKIKALQQIKASLEGQVKVKQQSYVKQFNAEIDDLTKSFTDKPSLLQQSSDLNTFNSLRQEYLDIKKLSSAQDQVVKLIDLQEKMQALMKIAQQKIAAQASIKQLLQNNKNFFADQNSQEALSFKILQISYETTIQDSALSLAVKIEKFKQVEQSMVQLQSTHVDTMKQSISDQINSVFMNKDLFADVPEDSALYHQQIDQYKQLDKQLADNTQSMPLQEQMKAFTQIADTAKQLVDAAQQKEILKESINKLVADNQTKFESYASSNSVLFFDIVHDQYQQILENQSLSIADKIVQLDKIQKSIEGLVAVENVYTGLLNNDPGLRVDTQGKIAGRIQSQQDFDAAYQAWQDGKISDQQIIQLGGDSGSVMQQAFMQKDAASSGNFNKINVASNSIKDLISANQNRFKNDAEMDKSFQVQSKLFDGVTSSKNKLSVPKKVAKLQEIEQALQTLVTGYENHSDPNIVKAASIDTQIQQLIADNQQKFANQADLADFITELQGQKDLYDKVVAGKLTGMERMNQLEQIQRTVNELVGLATHKGALPTSIKALLSDNARFVAVDKDFADLLNSQIKDLMTASKLSDRVAKYQKIEQLTQQFVQFMKMKESVGKLMANSQEGLLADADFNGQFKQLLQRSTDLQRSSFVVTSKNTVDVTLVDKYRSLQSSMQKLIDLQSLKTKVSTLRADNNWYSNVYEQLSETGPVIASQSFVSQQQFDAVYQAWKLNRNIKIRSVIPQEQVLEIFNQRLAQENVQSPQMQAMNALQNSIHQQLQVLSVASSNGAVVGQFQDQLNQIKNNNLLPVQAKQAKLQSIQASIALLNKQSQGAARGQSAASGQSASLNTSNMSKRVINSLKGSALDAPDAARQMLQSSMVSELGSSKLQLKSSQSRMSADNVDNKSSVGAKPNSPKIAAPLMNKNWYASSYESLPDSPDVTIATHKIISSKQEFYDVYQQWSKLKDDLVQEKSKPTEDQNHDLQQALSLQAHLLDLQVEASLPGATMAFEMIKKNGQAKLFQDSKLNAESFNPLIKTKVVEVKSGEVQGTKLQSASSPRKSMAYGDLAKENNVQSIDQNISWIITNIIDKEANQKFVNDSNNISIVTANSGISNPQANFVNNIFKATTSELRDLYGVWSGREDSTVERKAQTLANLQKIVDAREADALKNPKKAVTVSAGSGGSMLDAIKAKGSAGPKVQFDSSGNIIKQNLQAAAATVPLEDIVGTLQPIEDAVLAKESPLLGGSKQLLAVTLDAVKNMSQIDKNKLITIYSNWLETALNKSRGESSPSIELVQSSLVNLESK